MNRFFFPGQKVVCVVEFFAAEDNIALPECGSTYTVRGAVHPAWPLPDSLLLLDEVVNAQNALGYEKGFWPNGFRPVTPPRVGSIEPLRSLLVTSSKSKRSV